MATNPVIGDHSFPEGISVKELELFRDQLISLGQHSAKGPLVLFLSLPILFIAYVINHEVYSLVLGAVAVGIAFVGGFLQYTYLLSLKKFLKIYHGEKLSFTDFIKSALTTSLYIVGIGIALSHSISIRVGELIARERKELRRPCEAALLDIIVSLGIELYRVQSCVIREIVGLLTMWLDTASINLGAERDDREEESGDGFNYSLV